MKFTKKQIKELLNEPTYAELKEECNYWKQRALKYYKKIFELKRKKK
jgi:hypothetical protein